MQSFDLSHANQLSVSDAKDYIKRYFYPLASGLHVQVDYDEDEKYYQGNQTKGNADYFKNQSGIQLYKSEDTSLINNMMNQMHFPEK